jgi:dihydrolipoamide dehydrogenase
MATEVVVPILGFSNEKGKIVKWLKSEKDFVKKGEPIFELETDKVVTEIEAPATGILKKILIPEGMEVPVLTVVAIITEKREELPEKYRTVRTEALLQPPSPSLSQKLASKPSTVFSPRRSKESYDIAILGAGPGGYVSALRAAQLGARVLLIEKGDVGGTCLNRGCIPTKSFLSDINTFRKVRDSDLFINRANVSIDIRKLVSRKNRVVETMKRGISLLLESQGITFIKGFGRFSDSKTIEVSSNGKRKGYKAQHVMIATGSGPASIPTIGINGKTVLSSDEVLDLKGIPKNILIIGGGVIGVEFATIFNGLGAKVTVLEMLPQIISGEDEEVARGLRTLLKKRGIEILTGARVLRASSKKGKVEVEVERNGKKEKCSGEKVLMAIGRVPNTEGLNLEKIGVKVEGGFVTVNSKMETNVEGVYAIGDVIGKMMLAHAASAEGIIAVENILGKAHEIDYQKIPSCIYTFPEVASVGLKESEAKQKGYDIRIGKFPYLNSGKALATGEPEGFVKIIAEKELGQILGVQILGEHATELIGECLLAMNVEASIEDLGEVVKGHPTLSETITEAALDWQKKAIHITYRSGGQRGNKVAS